MAADAQVQHEYDKQMASCINVLAVLVYELLAISDTLISFCSHPWKACDRGHQEKKSMHVFPGRAKASLVCNVSFPKAPAPRRKVSAQFDISHFLLKLVQLSSYSTSESNITRQNRSEKKSVSTGTTVRSKQSERCEGTAERKSRCLKTTLFLCTQNLA